MINKIYNYAGIGFWLGAFIYSAINMIFNINQVAQHSILMYNYIISGAAVLGFSLNLVLLKRQKNEKR
jgi:membrane protein DedA with SNARE-associated domain